MVLSLLSASAGLMVGNAPTMRQQCINMAAIGDLLSSMDGPDLYWEEKGPLQNPPMEESDFKEYDTFSTFLAACKEYGVDLIMFKVRCSSRSEKGVPVEG